MSSPSSQCVCSAHTYMHPASVDSRDPGATPRPGDRPKQEGGRRGGVATGRGTSVAPGTAVDREELEP